MDLAFFNNGGFAEDDSVAVMERAVSVSSPVLPPSRKYMSVDSLFLFCCFFLPLQVAFRQLLLH